ncbi:MAG TPA: M12 family metallo-peptidase, partial [Saprospiraceae bacterium]|nr:M12 family metallo-peptidase [Saprospiraceae bacterium]
MRQFCTLFIAFGLISNLFAQTAAPNHWTPVALDAVVLPATAERLFEPYEYTAYQLDYDALVARLAQAPMEFTFEAGQKSCTVQIPQADGTLEPFAVVYTQVMAPGLAARYPEIRTYAGESMVTPGKRIRITTGPYHGLYVMITRPDKGIEYVEPVANGQNLYYMAYDRHSFPKELGNKVPAIAGERAPDMQGTYVERYSPGTPVPQDRGTLLNPVVLKVYRFACATTGEFAQDNGGTTASVLQKVTTTTNMLNAIYERDLAIRLELIEEEDQILYLNPATDPYTGTTVGGWLNQNPVAMLMQLGDNDKYDIGHVFARYMDGNAIGVGDLNSCCTDFKGRGCSAWYGPPYGDEFFAIVGQEIGHQWNGLHTWNHCDMTTEPFPNYERCEPGSGSTIMSYAGTCGNDNVQGSADLYYHVCSIFGIRNFVENGNGKLCGQNIATGNNPPVVTIAHPDNFF